MNNAFRTDTVALKKLMIDNGFDRITDLAKASKIDRTTLGKVLSGKIQPTTDVMYKLVATLCISPNQAGSIFFKADLRTA